MNFKRNVLILSIIICIFFSISCVVGADADDVNMTVGESQEMGDMDGELAVQLQDDGTSDGLSADSSWLGTNVTKGGFSELQEIIDLAPDGSTVTLESNFKYDDGFNKGQGILIAKNLTIDGKGHTLDGMSKSRILFILHGVSKNNQVILKNITFKNGFTRLYGGAIMNFADLTVDGCVFRNNFANTTGGALCSVGSLKCKKTTFSNNKVNGDAAAIFSLNMLESHKLFNGLFNLSIFDKIDIKTFDVTSIDIGSIINSLLSNVSLKPSTDNISGCNFYKNTASGYGGGAVYAYTHIRIVSSKFSYNKVLGMGGAVFAAKNLYLKSTKFIRNQAEKYGGAVYFKYHEMSGYYDKNAHWQTTVKYYSNTIEKCTFTENAAKQRGGALYGFKYSKKPKVLPIKAVKCTFSDNKAANGNEVYGGVLKNCVLKNTVVTLKKVNVRKSASKLVLTATLKKASKPLKSKRVVFNFNGKNHTAKTNSKGVAQVTIKSSELRKLLAGMTTTYTASHKAYYVFSDSVTVKVKA